MRTIRTIAALFVTIAFLGVAAPAEAGLFKKIVRTVSSAGGAVARAAEEAARAAARAAEEAARTAESGTKIAAHLGSAAAKMAGGDVAGGTEALIDAASTAVDATKAGVGAVPGMAGDAIEAGAGAVGAVVEGTKELADPTVAVGKLTIDTTKATTKFFVKGTGKILEESWEVLTRCYADAEKKTDPEERQEEIKKCDKKQTGNILGTVGMAIGAPFGPGGMALGAAGGSLAGSAIDGSPNIFIKTVLPIDPPAPEPESEQAPESEPAPEASPAPESEPAPEASPAPESEPAPEASPAPESEPAPEASPAPESEPAPEASPVPGAGFIFGRGRRWASVHDHTPTCDPGMDPWSDCDRDPVENFFAELEQQIRQKFQPTSEAVGTAIESTGTIIKDAVTAYGKAKDTEVVGPLLNIFEDMVKTMKWLGPGRVLSHLLKPTPLNVGEEDSLRDHGKRGSEPFEGVDTTPLPSATEEPPSSEPAPEDSPAPEPRSNMM